MELEGFEDLTGGPVWGVSVAINEKANELRGIIDIVSEYYEVLELS
jgi:hypothetical protein